jgi:hypothetical protein
MDINEAASAIRTTSILHGWEATERPMGDWIALAHSELSEAYEEYRDNHPADEIYHRELDGKPEGVLVELADCIIRCLHHMKFIVDNSAVLPTNVSVSSIIEEKMKFNEGRPYRHGGKRA